MSFLNQFSYYKINEPEEKEKEWRTIKAYKGMSKDMVCIDMQYEIGQTYTMPDEDVRMCSSCDHACAGLADVAVYYPSFTSRFVEVEIEYSPEDMYMYHKASYDF